MIAFLLTNFLLNKTLRQPDKAYKQIRIPLLGIYPLLNENPEFIRKANLKIMQQFFSGINFTKKQVVIGVLSNQKNEGKSMLINLWSKELQALNYSVESRHFVKGMLLNTYTSSDILLIEYPALDSLILTPGSTPPMDNCLLICRANRLWSKIDNELLNMFVKNTGTAPQLILNGVTADYAEEYIGEVPKKRTLLRTLLKKLAKREFGNRKMLKKA